MGSVIVLYRIFPDSPEHFEQIKKSLTSLKPDKMEEDPIAFGLSAIKFTKIVPDSPGAEEQLEDKIKTLPHIGTMETLAVTRSL